MKQKLNFTTFFKIQFLIALFLFIWGNYKYSSVQTAADSYQSFVDHLVKKNYAEAEVNIEKAVNLVPDNALYYADQGLLQARMIKTEVASKNLFAGNVTFSQEDVTHIKSAIQSYEKAISLSPDDDGFYHNLGWLYFFQKDKQQALTLLRKAIELDSTKPMYHISLGLIQEYYSELEGAYKSYVTAIRQAPSLVDSQFFLDLKTRSSDQADKIVSDAILALENKAKQDPSPLLKGKLGKLYLYKKSLYQAEKFLRESIVESPGLSRPWMNLGQLFEMQYNEDEMKRCYEIAHYLDSSDVLPAIHLADFYDRHNQIPQAISYYRKAVESWMAQSSLHTRQTLRLYNSRVVVGNDVIPEKLFYYCNPTFNIAEACLKLSIFYLSNGNEPLANYFDEIGKRFSP